MAQPPFAPNPPARDQDGADKGERGRQRGRLQRNPECFHARLRRHAESKSLEDGTRFRLEKEADELLRGSGVL